MMMFFVLEHVCPNMMLVHIWIFVVFFFFFDQCKKKLKESVEVI